MAEVGAIDVRGRFVELANRRSDAARQFGADQEREQFDECEYNRDRQQNIFHALGIISPSGKESGIQNRGASLDLAPALLRAAAFPSSNPPIAAEFLK